MCGVNSEIHASMIRHCALHCPICSGKRAARAQTPLIFEIGFIPLINALAPTQGLPALSVDGRHATNQRAAITQFPDTGHGRLRCRATHPASTSQRELGTLLSPPIPRSDPPIFTQTPRCRPESTPISSRPTTKRRTDEMFSLARLVGHSRRGGSSSSCVRCETCP